MKKDCAPPIHTWLILIKAMQAVKHYALPAILAEGLGDSDFRVLDLLLNKGPMPVNTIGPKVDLNSGSVSVAVDRLHKKGLVSRIECPSDRRIRTVAITECGRKFYEPIFSRHAKLIKDIFAEVTPEERIELETVLKKIGCRAEKLAQEALQEK